MTAPAIDLARRAWTFRRRGLTAIGTWINTGQRWRPCLVIIRTGEELGEHTVPCVVTIDRAWIWSEDIGDIVAAAHMTAQFLHALRLEPSSRNINRIRSLVHDLLGDLLTIPPRPPTDKEVVAEIIVTDRASGRTREVELTADV